MRTFCVLGIYFICTVAFVWGKPTDGTLRWFQQHNRTFKKPAAQIKLARTTSCKAESYYNEVSELATEHFYFYYTLEGVHAATPEFIDTLARYFEDAYALYAGKLKMKAPEGVQTTYHYQKSNHGSRYPVEVLDLDLVRNVEQLLGSPCFGCFGITFPGNSGAPEKTSILFDNDFRYTTITAPVGTLENGCTYSRPVKELTNTRAGYSYADRFREGIRITAYHELYHAVQARYYDFFSYYTFWLEASATGFEELGAPDVNDYENNLFLDFLPGVPLNETYSDYAPVILFFFLYQQYGISFDAAIWENYSKAEAKPFEEILVKTLSGRQKNADSVFHLFAEQLFFSGARTPYFTSPEVLYSDMKDWREFTLKTSADSFSLSYPAFDYLFLENKTLPDLSAFQGNASVALWSAKKKSAAFIPLDSNANFSEILKQMAAADSALLVLSRLQDRAPGVVLEKDSLPLRSFPNPWKGTGELCFSPLPENKKFIEIRNRIGKLVLREPYQGSLHCMEAEAIRQHLAPGLYRFRAGASGKTEPFLVIY
ncbi:MAG: hypothetical protein LBR60_01650 [Fibrobacter sp.]|jgi:hypothetical protein|nr:hypothetical protein [Fibrobacter sp.]